MAKGQRSNRQKALRSVRREKVTATWQEEADRKRMEALRACLDAPPVDPSEVELVRIAEARAAAARRGRELPEKMEMEEGRNNKERPGAGAGAKKAGVRRGRKGVRVGGGAGGVGGRKGRRKQVGVLSKMVSGNKFHKKNGKK